MKINIELNMPDDRIFLNFWNSYNADDVVCELKDGKLLITEDDEKGNPLPPKEITLTEFCSMVKSKVEQWPRN